MLTREVKEKSDEGIPSFIWAKTSDDISIFPRKIMHRRVGAPKIIDMNPNNPLSLPSSLCLPFWPVTFSLDYPY
jgi:hypothetical protein